MENKKWFTLPVIFLVAIAFSLATAPGATIEVAKVNAFYCVAVNGESPECHHNVITDIGLYHTVGLLFTNTGNAASNNIALGNGTAPAAANTVLDNEITNCDLGRAVATVYNNSGSVANKTMSYTWTSSCTKTVNTTGLFNATSGGTFFGGTSFTDRNLIANDQITVNYTIWATSA